jgi:hypothetical protein
MANDKPQDLKPATEFGEVKVIKNAVKPGKPSGSAEAGGPRPGQQEQEQDPAGTKPGNPER